MKKLMKMFVALFIVVVLTGCASEQTNGSVRIIDLVGDIDAETIRNAENMIVNESITVVYSNEDIAVRHYSNGGWVFLMTPTDILVLNSEKSDYACEQMFNAVVDVTSGLSNDETVNVLVKAANEEIKSQQASQMIGMIGICFLAVLVGAYLAAGGDLLSGSSYGGSTFIYVNRGGSSRSSFSHSSGGSYRGHR